MIIIKLYTVLVCVLQVFFLLYLYTVMSQHVCHGLYLGAINLSHTVAVESLATGIHPQCVLFVLVHLRDVCFSFTFFSVWKCQDSTE